METHSLVTATLDHGLILDVGMGNLGFTAYVVISEPDINLVASIVPQEQYEQHANLHVAAVSADVDAHEQVNDVAFNMDQGDAIVFLCSNEAAYLAVLQELGQHSASLRPN